MSRIHLVKCPSEGVLDEPSVYLCTYRSHKVLRVLGFLMARGAKLAARDRLLASRYATQPLTKVLPKPGGSKAKTCCPQRQAFSAVFILLV